MTIRGLHLPPPTHGERAPAVPPGFSSPALLERVETRIVGLRRPTEVLVTALHTGRHVSLEGRPGVGKSTLLREVAAASCWEMEFVEGNAELTPSRLVGTHDAALVLERGYLPEAFTEGPLVAAMREGGLLYIEELNRAPEETLNVLITALAEGEIHVPRLGHIAASPLFRLIAAMNPFDAVGAARVGQAIYDRMCRMALGHQDRAGEERIVEQVTGIAGGPPRAAADVGGAGRPRRRAGGGSAHDEPDGAGPAPSRAAPGLARGRPARRGGPGAADGPGRRRCPGAALRPGRGDRRPTAGPGPAGGGQ